MRTRIDGVYSSILVALGLELACAGRAGSLDEDGTTTGASESAEAGTTDSATSADTGTETGMDDPPPLIFVCDDPTPIMQAGTQLPSGYVMCANGVIHRVEEVECVAPQGEDDSECSSYPGSCVDASGCEGGSYASCVPNGYSLCECVYGCVTDADCAPGYACACAGVAGAQTQCIPADCKLTDECDGGVCRLSVEHALCDSTYYSLACTDEDDECILDSDCSPAPCPGSPEGSFEVPYYCSAAGEPGFTCEVDADACFGACGRPLLVAGRARSAASIEREDWQRAIAVESLDVRTRARLAAYWSEVGRFEHASVASFARFAGHLLQLGAPARLLRETQRAMADEIEHARLAFGLASAYAGVALGPGSLDLRDCIAGALERREIVEALVHEACVGETLAALEAWEAADHAEDPAVAAVLERVADDELRHAQLGWSSLRWMLDAGDEPLRRFALDRLDAALRALERQRDEHTVVGLRAHGVVDAELRAQVRRAALARLLRPCAAALAHNYTRSSEREKLG